MQSLGYEFEQKYRLQDAETLNTWPELPNHEIKRGDHYL
jgi:hypothetical protein